MKKIILVILALTAAVFCRAQAVKFAFLTDTHYSEGAGRVNSMKACIDDINASEPVDFVLFGGDITDFGTDEEIAAVKEIFDKLKYKYYVVAGNHDAKWSESGCNTFLKVFGYENFEFEAGGWRFLGCNCGPDMRMAPALLPKESMLWLESRAPGKKTVFVNHYPQDSSVLNYFDVTKALKRIGTQWEIGGHWHSNHALNFDGIPAALCRSTYDNGAGYSIVTLTDNHVSICERRVKDGVGTTLKSWYDMDLAPIEDKTKYDADGLPDSYPWMRYDVNARYSSIREVWSYRDDSNIATGFAINANKAYYATASGWVRAIDIRNGKKLWSTQLPGKLFSTPAVQGKKLVVGCTDGYVYGLNACNGRIIWKVKADKSIVASPAILDGVAYIGSSDGCFRAIRISDGKLVWKTEGIKGFVECTPYVDAYQVVFGTWGQKLYSLSTSTGKVMWEWNTPRSSRMLSPAATVPVKSEGRIFFAAPDRRVYAVDALTGKTLFWVDGGREAIGLSSDGMTVYAKTMNHRSYAFKADVNQLQVNDKGQLDPKALDWNVENRMGYEIGPSPIVEIDGVVLVPSDKGNLIALDAKDGAWLWAHKISIALVNPISSWRENNATRVLASTMDGKVVLLEY